MFSQMELVCHVQFIGVVTAFLEPTLAFRWTLTNLGQFVFNLNFLCIMVCYIMKFNLQYF